MYLIDTNIWLEMLLEQQRAGEVQLFFKETPTQQLAMTDFCFHSLGVILTRLKKSQGLLVFIDDVFVKGHLSLVGLSPFEISNLITVMQRFNLDFDDAYQYAVAEKYGLTIVSFDNDFNKTTLGKRTPLEIIQSQNKKME